MRNLKPKPKIISQSKNPDTEVIRTFKVIKSDPTLDNYVDATVSVVELGGIPRVDNQVVIHDWREAVLTPVQKAIM